MNKIILHFNNWAITGGIPSFIQTFNKAFPEFQHYMCSLRDGGEKSLIHFMSNQGIKCFHAPKITRELIEEIDPLISVLHNITNKRNEVEDRWMFHDRKVINLFHARYASVVPGDIDYFVSNYIAKSYDFKKMKKPIVCPPCVDADRYLKIKRPPRDKMVIGRIQSQTKGDVTQDFVNLLDSVENTDKFVVSMSRENPILPDKMPDYLSKIDVLAMWANKDETWSMVTTEAMLSGIPVVVHNTNDGMAEQMRKSGGGLLVKSRQGFKEALERLRDNPELRRELGNKGREWALKNASHHTLRKVLIDDFLAWL